MYFDFKFCDSIFLFHIIIIIIVVVVVVVVIQWVIIQIVQSNSNLSLSNDHLYAKML